MKQRWLLRSGGGQVRSLPGRLPYGLRELWLPEGLLRYGLQEQLLLERRERSFR